MILWRTITNLTEWKVHLCVARGVAIVSWSIAYDGDTKIIAGKTSRSHDQRVMEQVQR